MSFFLIHTLELTIVLSIILNVECTIDQIKCYQCEVTENHLCTDEYLLLCQRAYDMCLTRIYKKKGNQTWIYKNCALGPCALRDDTQTAGLGLDHCDRSQDEFDCISCCKGDGCNKNAGYNFAPALTLLTILMFFSSFIKYY
ncbi:uncharacterized protein [Parasteatoda tepidariorum]|uniref:uncharacterized protein n=1 Tax=Parasteatoda tepidariorum TaxID=114398 RepID=UPI001C722B96|nr:uncharacterized protein LOC107450936 [Parasteatoda tepidariorum]